MAELKKSARFIAVSLLTASEQSGEYIDHVLETSESAGRLSAVDHGLLLQLVNGVLRNKTFLDLVIEHYIRKGYRSFPVLYKNVLRSAFYQLIFLDRVPAYSVVSEAVEIAKALFGDRRAPLTNAVLRNYLRAPVRPKAPAEPENLAAVATYYSHPLWLVERFVRQYGADQLIPWLKANNRTPGVFVRALRPDETESLPPALRQHERIAGYYELQPGCRLESLPGWQAGHWIVQDPAAGLIVQAAGASPGARVIDLCAAPGGKTIALAGLIGPGGSVEAVEVSPLRAEKLRENLERTQCKNITVTVADAGTVTLPPADLVLVDAPCSGTGVIARRVDLRWNRKPADFVDLVASQKRILANAAKLVTAGGILLYATCSIDREENEEVAAFFINSHPEFRLEHAGERVDRAYATPEGFLKTLPHLHHLDGGFAARFRRVKDAEDKP